ncbi:MAG: excinuclease ABC subunit UvrA [Candidatus Paceibacterota bacterium]
MKISGVRVHNLKNISLELPKDKLIVFSGISGSGKSSLAFDTIFAEGQRRYIESLSSYARQFLGQMDKPDIDSVSGLSPAVAIDQKSTSKNPRSTVGTITEIYDHLRLLFSRAGIQHCPSCDNVITKQTSSNITDQVINNFKDEKITLLAPVATMRKGTHTDIFNKLIADGFSKFRVNGVIYKSEELPTLNKNNKHTIEVVVDRLDTSKEIFKRLTDSIETALKTSSGEVLVMSEKPSLLHKRYSTSLACTECQISLPPLEPRSFSFNSPYGACEACLGLGTALTPDIALVVPDDTISLDQGAIHPWGSVLAYGGYYKDILKPLINEYKLKTSIPWKLIPVDIQDKILHGDNFIVESEYVNRYGQTKRVTSGFEGVLPYIIRKHSETQSDSSRERWETYLKESPCSACGGARLKPQALSVKINNYNINDISSSTVLAASEVFSKMKLTKTQKMIADRVIKEITSRLEFLTDVGLHYLTLDRPAATLSGGEAQRIRLATQVGSGLVGVLYVLDEPSIGLHQKDNERLITTLTKLRDLGNTVIVVEHDEDTIKTADWVVDIGPRAGEQGGEVVHSGTYTSLLNNPHSLTSDYLAGRKSIAVPSSRRSSENFVTITKASHNNLRDIDIKIPVSIFTCITGVSGSGKSSLLNGILYPYLANTINGAKLNVGKHGGIKIPQSIQKLLNIDQSPIGRTPRSNPATYIGLFDHIRNLFANTEEAKLRGYDPGRFSFNKPRSGRCESCQGDGTVVIEMNFLPDVYIPCEECKGTRYNRETLQVLYKGKNISDILNMTVSDALQFFANNQQIIRYVNTLADVGLGYIRLGQPAPWLSGGEAQRVKLASELHKRSSGNTLYILDEPTTGLHFEDTQKLLQVLNKLVDQGNTVVVVEHNLDVIKTADFIIDLGPGGGSDGGTLVATGTPEEVAKVKSSYTGKYISQALKKSL